jgi:hypothetical protein
MILLLFLHELLDIRDVIRDIDDKVVEWLMAPVLKTGEVKASVGSNPTPSAFSNLELNST